MYQINNMYTHFFNFNSGNKQGDPLSPILFSLYITDLTIGIHNEHYGVTTGSDNVLCADDIVLLSDSSDKLQQLLNCLHK